MVDVDRAWDDRQLLAGVRRRDPDALKMFFDLAFPYVYNVAFRFAGHRQDAEDITQEVFLKIFRATHRLDADRSAKPWVTTIAYNACRDWARRSAARPEDVTEPATLAERVPASGDPEADILQKERERLVDVALRRLDEPSRLVIILHDFCGFPHDEVARLVDASPAATRKRHSRALQRMQEIIQEMQT